MSDTNIAITKASKASIFGVIVPPHIVNHGDPDQTKLVEFLTNPDEVDDAIIVAPRHVLENAKSTNLASIPDSDANYFKPAGSATPMILHPATYTAVVVEDASGERKVFAYERPGKMENEVRLGGKRSIGIGGHGDVIDLEWSGSKLSFVQSLENTMTREWTEEIQLDMNNATTYLLKNTGWLLDMADAVGCTHIGAVSIMYVRVQSFDDFKMPSMNSDGNRPLGLVSISEVTAENNYENWSVMLAGDYSNIIAKIEEGYASFVKAIDTNEAGLALTRNLYRAAIELLDVRAAGQVFHDRLIHSLQAGLICNQIGKIGFVMKNKATNKGFYFLSSLVGKLTGDQDEADVMQTEMTGDWKSYRELIGSDFEITLTVSAAPDAEISSQLREVIVRDFERDYAKVKFLGAEDDLLANYVCEAVPTAKLESVKITHAPFGNVKLATIVGTFN